MFYNNQAMKVVSILAIFAIIRSNLPFIYTSKIHYLIFNVLLFRVKEILHLNKLPYCPQSIVQLSSTNELKRKTAFRNILLGPSEIVSYPPPTKMNPKSTHFLVDSQLGIILHFRGCITELVRRNVDSTAFSPF